MWQQWTNAVLGLWLIVVPFTGMTGNTLTWALVITGVAVAALSLWGMQGTSSEESEGGKMVRHT
ncbi:SPW repeat protein [Candidatus Kaiserbacteria bacterium]|nr:SPW repeat protein [Candidatus Kaiserbacteria bacterium]